MNATDQEIENLNNRLKNLNKELLQIKIFLAFAIVALVIVSLFVVRLHTLETHTAKAFILTDANGQEVGRWANSLEGSVVLSMKSQGKDLVALGISSPQPRPFFVFSDLAKIRRLELALDSTKFDPYLQLLDKHERVRSGLYSEGINVLNGDGKVRFFAGVGSNETASIGLNDANEVNRMVIGQFLNGGEGIAIRNKMGRCNSMLGSVRTS